MAVSIIGDNILIFGVADKSYGFFESLEIDDNIQRVELADGDGDITAFADHGRKLNVTGKYVFRSTSSAPAVAGGSSDSGGDDDGGITLTSSDTDFPLDSKTVYVTSVKTSYSKENFKVIEFEGVHYPSLETEESS